MGRHRGNIAAVEQDLPFARLRLAENGHHQRRFARAIGTDHRDDFALIHSDVDTAQGDDLAVIGFDAAHIEQRGIACLSHSPTSASTAATSSSSTPR